MPDQRSAPEFRVIPGELVHRVLAGDEPRVIEVVESVYRAHHNGNTVNPPSYFLRFPDRPTSRIIALPASLGGQQPVDGLKWISSFPENIHSGLPRASAVLVLNDHETGYPLACMESSIISAARTAASAALAARALGAGRTLRRVGFIGAGLIARYVHTYLLAAGLAFEEAAVHDVRPEHAEEFAGYLRGSAQKAVTYDGAEQVIRSCDLVVFATVAATPHIVARDWFANHPLVLHISLRDLSPEIILDSVNIVDDVEHCLKADTSPHLAEQRYGNRDFLHGTITDVLDGTVDVPVDQTVIFSPFGLGVLDLGLARHILRIVRERDEGVPIPGFFHELSRYGS